VLTVPFLFRSVNGGGLCSACDIGRVNSTLDVASTLGNIETPVSGIRPILMQHRHRRHVCSTVGEIFGGRSVGWAGRCTDGAVDLLWTIRGVGWQVKHFAFAEWLLQSGRGHLCPGFLAILYGRQPPSRELRRATGMPPATLETASLQLASFRSNFVGLECWGIRVSADCRWDNRKTSLPRTSLALPQNSGIPIPKTAL